MLSFGPEYVPKGMCLTGMHSKMHLRVLEEHAPKVQLTNRHVAAFCPSKGHAYGIRGLKTMVF